MGSPEEERKWYVSLDDAEKRLNGKDGYQKEDQEKVIEACE